MNKPIDSLIFTVRGQRVILDADLAALYGVRTKRLQEQVKRNLDRFPEDFSFKLTRQEWVNLMSQFAASSTEASDAENVARDRSQFVTGYRRTEASRSQPIEKQALPGNRSQFATGSQRHRDPRSLPRAFTEHGAIMAASVLNSPEAVAMSVYVVRAFVQMREQLTANVEVMRRLAEIDKTLLEHDSSLRVIWTKLQPLLVPPANPEKRRIGFSKDEA